ncbi:hypothetical protein [Mucilaginibacter sp.]|jgi:hypothetical protein|uniref:hypothetical protein n=1 Tax=Mucilaginibacter sp. TaxID=1882438 RepID=UPI0035686301
MRLLTFVLLLILNGHSKDNDLDKFLSAYSKQCISVDGLDQLKSHVRFSNGHSCPEVIIAVFSKTDRQILWEPASIANAQKFLSAGNKKLVKGNTLILILKNRVFVHRVK